MTFLSSRSAKLLSVGFAGVLTCLVLAQVVFPQQVTIFRGKYIAGTMASLFESDDNRFVVGGGPTMTAYEAPLDVRIETVCGTATPQRLVMTYETKANTVGLVQYVDMWEWTSGQWVTVDLRPVTLNDQKVVLDIPLCWRFTQPNTGAMRMRFWVGANGPTVVPNWTVSIDQMVWDVDPS